MTKSRLHLRFLGMILLWYVVGIEKYPKRLNGLFLATRPLRVTPSDTGSHHVSRIDWRRGVDVTRWKGERDSFLSFVSKTLGFLPPGETPCDDDLCPYFSNLLHRFDELLSPLLTEVGLDWNLLYIDVVLVSKST
ncbi:hypothetical protein YC2023_112760 [Brassica napus]